MGHLVRRRLASFCTNPRCRAPSFDPQALGGEALDRPESGRNRTGDSRKKRKKPKKGGRPVAPPRGLFAPIGFVWRGGRGRVSVPARQIGFVWRGTAVFVVTPQGVSSRSAKWRLGCATAGGRETPEIGFVCSQRRHGSVPS